MAKDQPNCADWTTIQFASYGSIETRIEAIDGELNASRLQ